MKIQIFVILALVAIATARRRGGHWKKKQNSDCRYERGEWSACDTATNEATMTLKLKEGSSGTCEQTHTKTIPCARLEKLKAWKLKKEEKRKMFKEHMEEKKRWKKHKMAMREKFGLGCKYDISVTECNKETNLVTKTFTPTSDDTTVCKPETIAYSCQLHEKLTKWKLNRKDRRNNRRNRRKERKHKRINKRHRISTRA